MEWMIRGGTIGRGATATVSIATSSSGEFFAVKSAELSVSSLLQREQQILSNLNSPHIVKYVGSSITQESNNLYYNLFTEYISGGSLSDFIQRQQVGGSITEQPTIRSYTKDIILALDYLHSNSIVHCDVKSQNILIGEDGAAKLADLGCSKKPGISFDLGFTITGTPIFMAPEVARGEEQSFPADIWALGCTVIEMATGFFNPWPELTDPVSALFRIGYTDDIPEIPTSLSDDGRDFVKRCMERDHRERWTAKELLLHPFVNCEKTTEFSGNSSPFSVLNNGFWDLSLVVSEATKSVTFVNKIPSLPSPWDRMRNLLNLGGGGHDLKDWGWDENYWVTVRSEGESAPGMETEAPLVFWGLETSRDDGDGEDEYFDFDYWGDVVVSNIEINSRFMINNCKDKNNVVNSSCHSLLYLTVFLKKYSI